MAQNNETFLKGSICISDIKEEWFNDFNDKRYVNVEIHRRQTPDNYGNTHYISLRYKDEDGRWQTAYIGKCKTTTFDASKSTQQATRPATSAPVQPSPAQPVIKPVAHQEPVDDLPF